MTICLPLKSHLFKTPTSNPQSQPVASKAPVFFRCLTLRRTYEDRCHTMSMHACDHAYRPAHVKNGRATSVSELYCSARLYVCGGVAEGRTDASCLGSHERGVQAARFVNG